MLGLEAVGLDTAAEPGVAVAALPGRLALQGNLDPLALVTGGAGLDAGIDRVLEGFASRAHIFNLGHGILPERRSSTSSASSRGCAGDD